MQKMITILGPTASGKTSLAAALAYRLHLEGQEAEIRQIFCNGKTAWQVYNRLIQPRTGREAVCLPSTSPANARWTLERLTEAWSVILEDTE